MPRSGNTKKRSPAATASSNKNNTRMAKKKPSPDSVVCIDLTTACGTMDDYLIRPETERRLGSVRKELEPPSAKKKGRKQRGGLKTTGLENTDWDDEVIVIASDEEEEPQNIQNTAMAGK